MTVHVNAVDFVFQSVSDLNTAVPFYRDTLGLELEMKNDEIGWAEFALPPTTLALGAEGPQLPFSPGSGGGGVAMAVDDVESVTEELEAAGIDVLMDPVDTGVCHMATIADPDGNPILLHRRNDGTYGRQDPIP